jgi:hypothetical protein
MAHSTAKLPEIHIKRDTKRKIRPVLSNSKIGTSGLHRNVKIGEKRNSGMVFLPKNRKREHIL